MNVSRKQDILLETGTNELEIAEFGIFLKGEERRMQTFGINVAKIREIIKLPEFTRIPEADYNIMGVFKLRDKVIPLINLAKWLNEETEELDLSRCYVIVAEFDRENFGFLIHDIKTIHRLSWEKVLPPVTISESSKNNSITGVVNFDDRIMMMLDFEKIVSDINPELSLSIEKDKPIIENVEQIGSGRPKILVAEDSGVISDLMAGMLEKAGFEVALVNNGKLAWEYLQAFLEQAKEKNANINSTIQLIIADIEMPQLDGHTLCRKIKEHPDMKTLPVVLFSSLIYEEIKRKGDLIGADAQISKPQIGSLVAIIRELLRKKEQELKNKVS